MGVVTSCRLDLTVSDDYEVDQTGNHKSRKPGDGPSESHQGPGAGSIAPRASQCNPRRPRSASHRGRPRPQQGLQGQCVFDEPAHGGGDRGAQGVSDLEGDLVEVGLHVPQAGVKHVVHL